MARNIDKGLDFLVVTSTSGSVGGQRSATWTFSRDVIDVTDKDSGEDREYIYGPLSHSVDFDGVYIFNESGQEYLHSAQDNGFEVRIDITTGVTDDKHFAFSGYVTNRELTADQGDAATYSMTVTGTSDVTYEDVP